MILQHLLGYLRTKAKYLKTKAIWLGKSVNQIGKPLGLKWIKNPVETLGIFFSYDSNGNNHFNFGLKFQRLQVNLGIWRSRDFIRKSIDYQGKGCIVTYLFCFKHGCAE